MLSFPCLAGYVMWLLDQLLVPSCLHQRMTLLLTVSAVRLNGPRNQLPADSPDSRSWSLRSGFKGYCGTAWSFYCCYLRSLLTGEWTTWVSEFMNEASTHIYFFFSLLNFGFCWKVKDMMLLFTFYLFSSDSWDILRIFCGSCRKPRKHVLKTGLMSVVVVVALTWSFFQGHTSKCILERNKKASLDRAVSVKKFPSTKCT